MATISLQFRQFCCRSPARVFVTLFLVLIIIGNWLLTNRSPNSELTLSHSAKHRKGLRVYVENTSRFRKKNHLNKDNFIPLSHSEPADDEVSDDISNKIIQKSTELHSSDFSVDKHVAEPDDRMGELINDQGEKNIENEIKENAEVLNEISEEKERQNDMGTGSSSTHKSKTEHDKLEQNSDLDSNHANHVKVVLEKKPVTNDRSLNEIRPLKLSRKEELKNIDKKPLGAELKQDESEKVNKSKQNFSSIGSKQKATKSQFNRTRSPSNENNVLIPFVKAEEHNLLKEQFKTCVTSICKQTSISLKFHIVADRNSWEVAKKIFDQLVSECNQPFESEYHNVLRIAEKLNPITDMLREMFSAGKKSYYHNPVFFLTAALHKVLPASMKRVVVLDSDLKFQSDIKGLFDMFFKFSQTNIIGFAHEQQPTYRHALYQYRDKHKGTKIGDPPPEGIPGFNSGVVLLNLEKIRQARFYNRLLTGGDVKEMAERYQFKGHLGDQDFFTLLSFDYQDLFYIIPCSWNRQLCRFWEKGYEDVFDSYHKCAEPAHIFHGNCKTPIPTQRILQSINSIL